MKATPTVFRLRPKKMVVTLIPLIDNQKTRSTWETIFSVAWSKLLNSNPGRKVPCKGSDNMDEGTLPRLV